MARYSSPTLLSTGLALLLFGFDFSNEARAVTKKSGSSTSSSAGTKAKAKKHAADSDDDDAKPAVTDDARKKPKPDAAPDDADQPGAAKDKAVHAPSATLEPSDLLEFAAQPPRVQQLIVASLALTKLNLTYTYGSADPARGGMDCSGTIYCVLGGQGLAGVPRDSSEQYVWVRKAGGFQAVVSKSADSFEFDALRPGDLLFWTGTYSVQREIPVSHVMLYLGREKKTKQRVMFGASDGRSYHGVQRWGVSVFDFKMPKEVEGTIAKVDFVGYGPIPGLRGPGNEVTNAEAPKPAPEPDKDADSEKPAAKKPATPTPKTGGKSTGSGAKKKSR